MNRIRQQRAARPSCVFILFLFTASFSLSAPAQQAEPEPQLQQLRQLLQELDSQADACLISLSEYTPEETPAESLGITAPCQQFLSAIDGEPLANYLTYCRQLTQWRTQYVNRHATGRTPDSTTAGSTAREGDLQRLVDIEFYCGEDALRQRTESVFNAFAALRQASGTTRRFTGGGSAWSVPQSDRGGEVRAMHERVRQETQLRWQQLQLDLLRQQSRQPLDYGLIQ